MSGKKSKSPPQPKPETAGPVPQDYSVNALAKLLGKDRRTIDKAVVGISPTRTQGKTRFYKLQDVEQALLQKANGKLRDEKLGEEIRKLRIANDEAEGKLIPKTKVCESIQRCMGPMVAILEQRLVNEFPTAVAGRDIAQCRVHGKRLADELILFCQSLSDEWK